MKRWQRIALCIGLVAVVGGATAAFAHGARRGAWKQMISNRVEAALDEIDATPDQRAKIGEAKDLVLQALDKKAQARRQAHPDFAALFAADKLDTDALYNFADRRAQDAKDLAQVIVPALKTAHDTLTPEQRKKVAQIVQQHHRGDGQGGFGGQ
jgi:Spy/CpxP family protein refolding chaperone